MECLVRNINMIFEDYTYIEDEKDKDKNSHNNFTQLIKWIIWAHKNGLTFKYEKTIQKSIDTIWFK